MRAALYADAAAGGPAPAGPTGFTRGPSCPGGRGRIEVTPPRDTVASLRLPPARTGASRGQQRPEQQEDLRQQQAQADREGEKSSESGKKRKKSGEIKSARTPPGRLGPNGVEPAVSARRIRNLWSNESVRFRRRIRSRNRFIDWRAADFEVGVSPPAGGPVGTAHIQLPTDSRPSPTYRTGRSAHGPSVRTVRVGPGRPVLL